MKIAKHYKIDYFSPQPSRDYPDVELSSCK